MEPKSGVLGSLLTHKTHRNVVRKEISENHLTSLQVKHGSTNLKRRKNIEPQHGKEADHETSPPGGGDGENIQGELAMQKPFYLPLPSSLASPPALSLRCLSSV